MIAMPVLLLTGLAPAQTNQDARTLLQQIAAVSHSAKSWFGEGVIVHEVTGGGMHAQDESRFKVAYQSPLRMLWETTAIKETVGEGQTAPRTDQSGSSGTRIICDGNDHWTYNWPGSSFYHSSAAVSNCKPEIGDFSKIADNLLSATVVGSDQVLFGNATKECELLRAEYITPTAQQSKSATAHSVRTLCVDPAQKLVLRDRTERTDPSGVAVVETTTYGNYQRDADLPADLFQFQVPTGYFEDDGPQ